MPLAIEYLQNAFQWTWQTSVQASLFVSLVLLILFIWGQRLSPRWRMVFGLLILTRLMAPVLPESSFSYLNLIPTRHTPSTAPEPTHPNPRFDPSHALSHHSPVTVPAAPIPSLPSARINSAALPPPADAFLPNSTHQSSSRVGILGMPRQSLEENGLIPPKLLSIGGSIVWVFGMLFMTSNTLIRRNRLLRIVNQLPPLPAHTVTAKVQGRCLTELNIARAIPVVECPQIETATVFGFLRPVILVSPQLERNFSRHEIRNILLHELAHIQRADILWNWLAFAVHTAHWFNPLAYLAARRFRADRELACDARVLKCLSNDEHQQYGNTLIKIAELSAGAPLPMNPALAPFLHRTSEIKNRITMIAKPAKTSTLSNVALVLLLGLFFSVAFTRAADDQPERNKDTPKPHKERKERKEHKERSSKPECSDCEKPQKDKPPSREAKRRDPQPQRTERDGRPPQAPEGREPQDMPPDAGKFAERVREFHQRIGNLHREGNSEAARDVQAELHEFIKDHAELARRAGPAIHGPGGKPDPDHLPPPTVAGRFWMAGRPGTDPDRRPPSPEADTKRAVGDELRKAERDGRRGDAERLRRHLEEMERHPSGRPGRPGAQPDDKGHEMARRIEHMHLAAKNLEQAGMHEEAHRLQQQAEHMEREFHQTREGAEREHGEQVERAMRELHGVVDQLKKEIEHLKAELRKRDGGGA